MIMSDYNQELISEKNFKYGKKYYFNKSGMDIDEREANRAHCSCKKLIKT